MKFDRLMDYISYVIIIIFISAFVYTAVSILYQLEEIRREMEKIDEIERRL